MLGLLYLDEKQHLEAYYGKPVVLKEGSERTARYPLVEGALTILPLEGDWPQAYQLHELPQIQSWSVFLLKKKGEEGDLRRDWAIADFQVSYDSGTDISTPVDLSDESKEVNIWKRNPGKWRRVDWDKDAGRFVTYEPGSLAQLYTGTNFPLMRYADVLLMKAEAINESLEKPNAEAYDAVNQVRRRAYGFDVYTPNPACDLADGLDYKAFRQAVRDERFRELCFEGQRKWDLIRWGVYVDTMHELADDVMATAPQAVYQYCARAGQNTTERNVLFPIPNTELTVNKKIEQNPGW